MTRKELERLQRRIEAIRAQYKTGVSSIYPDLEAGGYILSCGAYGARPGDVLNQESHHDSIEEAQAAYQLFLQVHPTAYGDDTPLIIFDI